MMVVVFRARRPPKGEGEEYARLVSDWIASIGLDPRLFGTHSLR
jgi:hypothetical protein